MARTHAIYQKLFRTSSYCERCRPCSADSTNTSCIAQSDQSKEESNTAGGGDFE
jgi:hypothetical protein